MFEGTYYGLFSFAPGGTPDRFALLHLELGSDQAYTGYYGMGTGITPDPGLLKDRSVISGKHQEGCLLLSVEDQCSQHAGMVIRVDSLDPVHGKEVEVSLIGGAVRLQMTRIQK